MKFGLAQAGMRMVLVSLPCSTPSRRCFADDQAHSSTQLVRGWILPVFTGYNTLGGGHGVNGEKKDIQGRRIVTDHSVGTAKIDSSVTPK